MRKEDNVMEDIKLAKVKPEIKKEEVQVPLWCPRCQQGINHEKYKGVKEGVTCPICQEQYDIGNISRDSVSKLWTSEAWASERIRLGGIQKELSKRGKVAHIDTQNENRIADLESQLADMKEMVSKLQPK
jgi:hypothetical protein